MPYLWTTESVLEADRRMTDWDRRVLAFDPCAGDKDDGGVRRLSDRIVTARAGGTCWVCSGAIVSGTRIRVESAIVDGRARSCRTCHECCNAMARSWDDEGAAFEARLALRTERDAAGV